MKYCCIYCDRKKQEIQMQTKTFAFYYLYSHLSGSLTMNKSLWLRWKSSKLCNTSNCNQIWIHIHLAPCLPFQMQICPSKHIAFGNQSSKSLTSNFHTEFRNSLPVNRLLGRVAKANNFHSCPTSVSYQSLSYLQ